MVLETKFSIGDKVFAAYNDEAHGPLTIGMVRAEIVDSPGRPGEDLFSNYLPQKGGHNEYMCVETGIRSGSCYAEDRIFYTLEEAQNKLKEVKAAFEAECAAAKNKGVIANVNQHAQPETAKPCLDSGSCTQNDCFRVTCINYRPNKSWPHLASAQ